MISISQPSKKVSNEFIHSFYYLEFDQQKEKNSGIVIDDACYELMFVKENNVKLINGGNETLSLPSSYTFNNLTGPFKFDFEESFTSFCIKLQPWMNASFVPTKKPQLLDLNHLYPKIVNQVHRNLFEADSFEKMVNYAEEFLITIEVTP
ncbi:MAG: DUF6597 domain-containing transcriptional factor, partial [Bacteroidota bacterium]